MARNKSPEETINLILDVSMKLFLEKGYEQTTIQDIINHLGGLTKGAIYHHFKSKEDIMIAALERLFHESDRKSLAIVNEDHSLSGIQKLRKLFEISLYNNKQFDLFGIAINMLDNPTLLALLLRSIIEQGVPMFVLPVIEQGIKDGSIQTDYPKEMAEVILLLSNIWMTPLVLYTDIESLRRRFLFFKQLLLRLGLDMLDIFDDALISRLDDLYLTYEKRKNSV